MKGLPEVPGTDAPQDTSAGARTLEEGTPEDPLHDDEQPRAEPASRRWCRFTRLMVSVTVAWAIFLVLLVLLTGRWWPWSLVEATPPVALVAVPLLLLAFTPLARPVRRWLSGALVLLLVVGAYLGGFGVAFSGIASGAPAGTAVKVFAWNTEFWQMTDDKNAFYEFLRRQNADVYLLQEYLYWREDQTVRVDSADRLSGDLPVSIDDTARLHAEFPGYRILAQGELLTLTRLPVVSAPSPQVAVTGTDWFWQGTKSQRTDILVGGRTVSFYNVHVPVPFRIQGNPFGSRFSQYLKAQNMWRNRELGKLRANLSGNPYPAVVAGDFNSPWMGLSPLGAGTRSYTPRSSWLPARSWPASDDFSFPRLWRLDWLYTKGHLAVTDYRFGSSAGFSDHATQQIRLVVPGGPA